MTESTSWQPPVGSSTPPPTPPFAGATPTGAPQGWTPPPKPGLIPLRPLPFATLLAAPFRVLRRNPRPTFGFALLVTGVTNLVTLLVVGFVTFFAFSRVATATGADAETLAAGAVGLVLLSALVPIALSIIGSAVVQGVISLDVARGTLGEKLRLPGLFRAARGRIGALIGWSLLIATAVILVIAVLAGLIAALVVFGGVAGIVIAVLLGLLLGAVALAGSFWLSTKLALVPSVLMLERLSLRAALARSWSLTTGFFWKTLGTLLLVNVIVSIATSIVTTPLQLLLSFGTTLINPNQEQTGLITAGVVLYVVTIVLAVVFTAIGLVVMSATSSLIYIDIRMRKEGLDLELSRFVEARQAGDTSVENPYLTSTSPAATVPES